MAGADCPCRARSRETSGQWPGKRAFLNWLKDREISKSQAYSLIELADSADTLLTEGYLEPSSVNRFSKRAFVETAQAAPEVQQMVCDLAKESEATGHPRPKITRREVRQLSDEWTAMSSDLLPETVRGLAATNVLPPRLSGTFGAGNDQTAPRSSAGTPTGDRRESRH
ncbi:hypothetical protein [Neosynechococcus sphagnicola]|uniref:hypothetical protein n=1 Tax=Neosynechococcus sphagnicola TaxID=1501145 RepID=UPI00308454E2